MATKITDLNASFVNHRTDAAGHHKREGLGVLMDCPCGCEHLLYVAFSNPIDGGPADETRGWQRTGDTLETLTLTPSVQRIAPCTWHGFITNGEAVTC